MGQLHSFAIIICSIFLFSSSIADESITTYDRKLVSKINPGLDIDSNKITLMYIQAIGENDVIHNIWDFTYGTPTILYAITRPNVTLDVIWSSKNIPEGFKFSESPKYSFGLQINRIWEFNDVNNTVIFHPSIHESHEFKLSDLTWDRTDVIQEDGEVLLNVISHSIGKGQDRRQGNITVRIDLLPFTTYAFDLPHLIHSANSSLVDIILENVTLSSDFNNSRFAIELIVISTEKSNDKFTINVRKGLDDEHTPGVFEIIEIISPETAKQNDGAFLQYRPVSYNMAHRDVSSSIGVSTGDLVEKIIDKNSSAFVFFSEVGKNFTLISESSIITFGDREDGFYKKTNYTLWAFTVGYGKPPLEGFSLFVILILSIGLGIPVLLLISGGIYICLKRRSKSRNQPVRLVEE